MLVSYVNVDTWSLPEATKERLTLIQVCREPRCNISKELISWAFSQVPERTSIGAGAKKLVESMGPKQKINVTTASNEYLSTVGKLDVDISQLFARASLSPAILSYYKSRHTVEADSAFLTMFMAHSKQQSRDLRNVCD